MVHPARIELTLLVPETSVLSVELRVHIYLLPILYHKNRWGVEFHPRIC